MTSLVEETDTFFCWYCKTCYTYLLSCRKTYNRCQCKEKCFIASSLLYASCFIINLNYLICFSAISLSYLLQWEGTNLFQMGWSVSEDLLSVAEDGTIYAHTLHGELIKMITPGQVLYWSSVCSIGVAIVAVCTLRNRHYVGWFWQSIFLVYNSISSNMAEIPLSWTLLGTVAHHLLVPCLEWLITYFYNTIVF